MVADAAFEQVEFSQREGCRLSPLRKYMLRVRRAKAAWGADVMCTFAALLSSGRREGDVSRGATRSFWTEQRRLCR